MKFGNDHIFDMTNFDELSRWMGWPENVLGWGFGLRELHYPVPNHSASAEILRSRVQKG
jgi:hypothetical protein